MSKLNSPNKRPMNQVVNELCLGAGRTPKPRFNYLTDPGSITLEGTPDFCPFCGYNEITLSQRSDWQYFFKCLNCGATAGYAYDPNESLALWNRRYHPAGSP